MTDSRFQASEKNQEIWGKALKGGRDTVIILVTGQRDVLHETEGLLWQGRPQKQNIRQPYTAGCQGMMSVHFGIKGVYSNAPTNL